LKLKYLALIFLLSAIGCPPQKADTFRFDSAAVMARMKRDVSVLASDSLGGRPSGTPFEAEAAAYIREQWRHAGLASEAIPFEVRLGSDQPLNCQNLAAFLDKGRDSTVVVAAHYDHLGQGSGKSLEIRKTGIHPGADDNASGVALMLELARSLQLEKDSRYNYLFVAFSAHEIGLFGSKDFVQQPLLQKLKVKFVLNFDMVGRLSATSKTVRLSYCIGSPSPLQYVEVGKKEGLYILMDDAGTTINDYSVFCEANIPAISLTTGIHDDYHRISDIASKLNYEGMLSILALAKRIVSPNSAE
jgi:hypothetical protein